MTAYRLVFGGIIWYTFALELFDVQQWDGWRANDFHQRKRGVKCCLSLSLMSLRSRRLYLGLRPFAMHLPCVHLLGKQDELAKERK